MITTLRAASRISDASSAVAERTGRAAAVVVLVWIVPKAPNSTFEKERFMARHMITDRMNPEEPSSAPATIRSLLSRAKPMALADKPAYELSNAITVGISAPPIGIIKRMH